MGIKLEYLLTILTVGVLLVFLLIDVENTQQQAKGSTKELEFKNTLLVEVDTDDVKSYTYSVYGERDRDVLKLDTVVYITPTIEFLVSKKGRFENHLLYLDGDVVLQEKDGYRYETQHAIYNETTKILNIISPFFGVEGNNTIEGASMVYDTQKKKGTSLTVDTVLEVSEK
jgi:hypothetical protein